MTQHTFRREREPSGGSRPGRLVTRPWHWAAVVLMATSACGTSSASREDLTGEQLFSTPFPRSNGRSCATCHVPEDNFTLTPDHVARLLETNPDDPLFNAIDADDPTAEKLTFEHLKKGLVRVWLTLPDNVDLIDDEGNVITPGDRKLFVWRGVPSIADSALTAPFQLDGRMKTLEDQAQGAITGHSEGGEAPRSELERIAAFERDVFSSNRARSVAEVLAGGGAPESAPDVEDELDLTPTEERGREVYKAICAACHGGGNQATIVDRDIHDLAFPVIKPDGTVLYEVPATDPPTPVLAAQPKNEFLNIGSAYETFMGQLDPDSHVFTRDVSFPRYRYRFYTDDSRREIAADLPPTPPPGFDDDPGGDGDPAGLNDELDSDGNPVAGPNFGLQLFSADPGRSMITGSPNDFEAFDVPTLRGIGKTAPYFHDNAADTLERVVDVYSDHLLSRFPSLTLPGEKEPDDDGDIGPPEALTADQKSDLVAFLKRL
ncbi:cytochrome c peroxidase [Sorangium sp. So ce363]|uniref:cytochrome c peroxidase n=1 Tax=Sorangium sp. So ce363 TaxID=3133304 RepID=UPI003F6404C5